MKNSVEKLPEGYTLASTLDLMKDKKAALIVNGAAIVIFIVFAWIGWLIHPHIWLFDMEESFWMTIVKTVVFLALNVLYIFGHEWIHGVVMKYYSHMPVSYGFTGLYAYAGSKAYFDKHSYIIIALAPIVFWGIVLLVVNLLVPEGWWWIVYFIQLVNLSGAAGDIYCFIRFSKLPDTIYIQDDGTCMRVYEKG